MASWWLLGTLSQICCFLLAQDSSSFSFLICRYSDGCIRLFHTTNHQLKVVLNGHRSAISAFRFDAGSTRLLSGSKDTDIVAWDLLAETGLFRLRGHKDAVTQIRFLTPQHILTSAKDTTMRLWDLDMQYCYETVVGHRHEITDFELFFAGKETATVWTVSVDPDVHVWSIDLTKLGVAQYGEESDTPRQHMTYLYSLPRQLKSHRATQIKMLDRLCLVATNNKGMEGFYLLTEEELAKKRAKRLKRKSKKGNSGEVALTEEDRVQRTAILRCPAKIKSIDVTPMSSSDKVKVFFGFLHSGYRRGIALTGCANRSLWRPQTMRY